jgi:hypothetical protein
VVRCIRVYFMVSCVLDEVGAVGLNSVAGTFC